jgi:formylmethanofuran dehydrogenase subunit B
VSAIVGDERLLPGIAALSLLLRDRWPGRASADLPIDALSEIARQLREARYGAIVWDLSTYAATTAELVVEYVADILRRLNARTRCVGLPLGGSGNALGAMQAALWQTGWPLRVSFAEGVPSHDPWRHDAARISAAGETDAVFWVAALAAEPPPMTSAPVIALVADDAELAAPTAVEIRVGIPGVDHGGEFVRSDAVIAVPLVAVRASDRPSVADVARAVLGRLAAPL